MTVYARDLKKENQTDAFMGEGFEALLKKAKEQDRELVVGKWCANYIE